VVAGGWETNEADGEARRRDEEDKTQGEQSFVSDGNAFGLGHSDSCIEASEFLERFLE